MMLEMVKSILIEVYATLAHQERETILQRQSEGIAAAKAKGKHLGRPKIEPPKDWIKYYRQWKAGTIRSSEFMAMVDMKKATFYKYINEFEKSFETLRG